MKLLYLITGLRLGGAEKQLLLLTCEMRSAGHEVVVVAMESGGALRDEFINSNITIEELGMAGFMSIPTCLKKLSRIVTKYKPDLIHAHMIHANILASILKLMHPEIKLVCTAHNIKEGGKLIMTSYHFVKTMADWCTNVSNEAYQAYLEKKYFNIKNSSYLPNAIDTRWFDPGRYDKTTEKKRLCIPDEAFVFFSAGRLHDQKNFKHLIRSFAMVKENVHNALLFIAGEGHQLEELSRLSIELNIADKIHFLGRQSNMPQLMKASDCFVLSSKFEGFGLVVGEAMAMLLPVISTDCGGVREVIAGHGALVSVDDINGLANEMVAMANGKRNYDQHSARQHIQDTFGVANIVDKWTTVYRKVCLAV